MVRSCRQHKLLLGANQTCSLGHIPTDIAELAEKIPEIEFNILGVGDDETEFRSIAEELNLGSRIRFGVFVPIDNLLEALKGMQVGVVPNRKSLASELMLPVKML